MNKPLLIFDGDCGFCRGWIARWKQITRDRVDYASYQDVAPRFPDIPLQEFQTSVHLIETNRHHTRAAEAVCRSLRYGGKEWPLRIYTHMPGARFIMEAIYRHTAGHRTIAGTLTRWLWGAPPLRSTYQQTRPIFLRGLAFVYVLAFASLIPQIKGLLGSNGILPAGRFLDQAHSLGVQRFFLLPTLAWWGSSDHVLQALCIGGAGSALLALMGFIPGPLFLMQWILYLSLVSVGRDFLSFQWDALLLETGFLAIFFAPWTLSLKKSSDQTVSRPMLWLLRWLLFRLMIQSAWVKWSSGDPLWRTLTALTVHFETQPLPNGLAWWVHQLPVGVLKGMCAGMFFIEGIVPFFIFAPRRLRLVACAFLVFLQSLILLTGNYGFFNILTLVLCLTLIDDRSWAYLKFIAVPEPDQKDDGDIKIFQSVVACFLFVMSLIFWAFQVGWQPPRPIVKVVELVYPFRSINDYGLFAVMTPTRPEIEIEGSDDAQTWKRYEFKYKPEALNQRPRQVAPFQPRLDWQMWFAALSDYRHNPWFLQLCLRLLQGSPPVLALFKTNPFPDHPPRYIRASVYDYHFTTLKEYRATGHWWKREPEGSYLQPISLRH